MNRLLILAATAIVLTACSDASTGGTPEPFNVELVPTSISGVSPFQVAFTATATGSQRAPLQYLWDFGDLDTVVAGTQSASRTYLHVGQYAVSVTVTDGSRTAVDQVVINVLEPMYYGDWVWIAMYPDESYYSGILSITLAVPDADGFTATSAGIWSWQDQYGDFWDVPFGYGLMGTFTADGQSGLVSGLVDFDNLLKMVAVDYDNRIGAEFDGAPSFYGEGLWVQYSGVQDSVLVGMSKVDKDPLFAPAPNYSPTPLSLSALAGAASSQVNGSDSDIDTALPRLQQLMRELPVLRQGAVGN